MKRFSLVALVALLLVATSMVTARAAENVDLRRAVPEDAFLVVQAKHNPERDYQQKYYDEVWKAVQDARLLERVVGIITAEMEEEDVAKAKDAVDKLRAAVEPIDIRALANCEEMIYSQQMIMWQPGPQGPNLPMSQHMMLVRVTPDVAASTVEGVKNLFNLAVDLSDNQLSVSESAEGDAHLVTLDLPPQSPVQPTVGQLGNVFLFCTSKEQLVKSLEMIQDEQSKSKFDDPRLAAALKKLPQMEDKLIFYDGSAEFAVLRKIGPALSQLGGGDKNVERLVKLLDMVLDEVSVFDHEVTVEYTEGNLNRTASYGKLVAGTDDSTLRKMVSSGEPFEKWSSWVPAGSLSYALGTGVNLHVLYERIIAVLEEDFPETADALQQFEQLQQQFDIFLDKDIFQAFSGEYATISVATDGGKSESVLALRCHKPERIKELIHRGIEALQQMDEVKKQQLQLTETKDLEGFENISANPLMMMQLAPVIGFRDGWMYVGQSTTAVKKVLDTKAGNGEPIDQTESFKRLGIDIEGPVRSIRYVNTADSIHRVAAVMRQAGFMFPMMLAMAKQDPNDKSLEPVKKLVALLPDVANIVEKFDFLEAKMSVVQQGDDADSYTRRSVVVVRSAEESGATP